MSETVKAFLIIAVLGAVVVLFALWGNDHHGPPRTYEVRHKATNRQ